MHYAYIIYFIITITITYTHITITIIIMLYFRKKTPTTYSHWGSHFKG